MAPSALPSRRSALPPGPRFHLYTRVAAPLDADGVVATAEGDGLRRATGLVARGLAAELPHPAITKLITTNAAARAARFRAITRVRREKDPPG
jgi:hypothetical protein